jgi:hypothetical protein
MGPIGTAGKGPLACEKYNASIVLGDHAIDDSSGAIERIFPSKKLHNPQYYPVFQLVTGIEYGLNVATKNATACIDLNGVCGYHKHLKTKGGSM